MAGSLIGSTRAALSLLAERAPAARTRADLGDPSDLRRLLPDTLRDVDARHLDDPGARGELEAEHPALGAEWARWADAKLDEEAAWRASAAHHLSVFGDAQVELQGLTEALADWDDARREAAWRVSERVWTEPPLGLKRWLARPAPEPEPRRAAPAETTTASGLIIPDSGMIAAVLGGRIDEDDPRPEPTSNGSDTAEILGLVELARELIAALGQDLRRWPDWSRAIQGACHDFGAELEPRRPRRLPYPRPFVPLLRAGAAAAALDHTARSLLVRSIDQSSALASAMISDSFVRTGLGASSSDRLNRVRELALAWIGLGVEAAMAGSRADDPGALSAATKWITPDGAPGWWAGLAAATPLAAGAAGEESALYAHDGRLWTRLRRGAQVNLQLRERHDDDWFRDDRVDPVGVEPAAELDSSALLAWLRDATRL